MFFKFARRSLLNISHNEQFLFTNLQTVQPLEAALPLVPSMTALQSPDCEATESGIAACIVDRIEALF